MVKIFVVKNIKIQKLMEIASNNKLNYVEMCHMLGIGTSTWNRWTRGISEPTNKNIIVKIDKVIT